MGTRTGSADLPLHGGRVPRWLGERMARLGRLLVEAIVLHYGRDELLCRLAHPFWFQSLGCVMGMDWHSSGITTSVLGALKRGLRPIERELGLTVCGGRGRHSLRTPEELRLLGERVGLDGELLARTSRLVAKVDSAAVQDGFALYLHGFIVADDGGWAVVQQGMSPARRQARRYHWLSLGGRPRSLVEAPHAAIEGPPQGEIVNLTDLRAGPARDAQVALARSGPDAVLRPLRQLQLRRGAADTAPLHLVMPDHHDVREDDVQVRRLRATLAAAAERGPADFADLLLVPGVGARTVESLALVAEVIHGAPCRFADPARFSFAHGGKDGHPFPVPVDVYDETLRVMRAAVTAARLGNDERLGALQRLDAEARRLEREVEGGPGWDELVAQERRDSAAYGGRTVLGPAGRGPEIGARRPSRSRLPRSAPAERQLCLPGLDAPGRAPRRG